MAINFPSNPTVNQTYTATHINLHGTVVSGDKDYVTFTVGVLPITALYLSKYISTDNKAFFAIQQGTQFTAGNNVTLMTVYGHFGPAVVGKTVGNNVLGSVVLTANTTYTMWIQQTGASLTEYAFSTDPTFSGSVLPTDYSDDPLAPTTITYTPSGSTWIWNGVTWNIKPPGSNFDDLADVAVISATDGQVLYYNGTTRLWEPLSLTSSFNGGSIGNALIILNSTASGDYQSGALIVSGGVGVAGAIRTNSSITAGSSISSGTTVTAGNGLNVTTGGASITGNSTVTGTLAITSTTTLDNRAELRFRDTDNSNYVSFRAPNNLTTNTTYQLPATDGTAGQSLITNGSGILTWSSVSGGGGGGSSNPPGGVTGNVQFNNNGSFGGVVNFNYDQQTDTLSTVNTIVSGSLDGNATGTITNIASFSLVGQTQPVTAVSDDPLLANNASTSVTTEAAVKGYVDTGLGYTAPIDSPTFTGTVSGITNDMIGLGNVENTALSTWPGSSNITTVGTLTELSVAGNISVPTTPSQTTHATNKKYVDTRAIAMSIALS
jgi:hypothetical protein